MSRLYISSSPKIRVSVLMDICIFTYGMSFNYVILFIQFYHSSYNSVHFNYNYVFTDTDITYGFWNNVIKTRHL
jgi:hypothetical protein